MKKPAFCICTKEKGADQLHGNRTADQRLCNRYINSKPVAILCGCIARFVSELVENPDDRLFSRPITRLSKDKGSS